MQEYILNKTEHNGVLSITLKDYHMIDPYLIDSIQNDAYCLDCTIRNQQLEYRYDHLVPLSHFFTHYIFHGEEGYWFLEDLLQKAINVNRNKPVFLDLSSIYVSRSGTEIRFVVLPLKLDYWLYRKEQTKNWIKTLADHFQVREAYELSGYLYQSLRLPEFSLPNLILGIQSLRQKFYPKKWYQFKKVEPTFETSQEILPYVGSSQLKIEEESFLENEPTQILHFESERSGHGSLEDGNDRYDLLFDQMLVGRAMSCEIRIQDPSVSLKHAKILRENERYYIQDLKSANGTYLNEKRVQRKMRLKEGMKVIFGNKQLTFHEAL